MQATSPVCIPYELLVDENADVAALIEKAFGPAGLGLLTVSGVPGFSQLRERLLPLAEAFANLPPEVRAQHEDPESSYNFGWSHGKEQMAQGRPDVLKGSFYANPTVDVPDARGMEDMARYAAYMRPNLWPREALPELEGAFKALGRLMVQVGLLLAAHCDRYLASRLGPDCGGAVRHSLAASQCHKGRLLHYFPPAAPAAQLGGGDAAAARVADQGEPSEPDDAWCGWHRDHGALTGLCSALFMREGRPVPNPDPAAGLYIRTRGSAVVQACIPPDQLGYQIGQALAIQSGGLLQATPHCVRAARVAGMSRNTFAVFMQPDVHCPLSLPAGRALDTLLAHDQGRWHPGMSFGEFAETTMREYYVDTKAPPRGVPADGNEGDDARYTDAPARSALRMFVVHE